MTETINKSLLEVAVGTSIKQDAREAGREVAETAIKNLSQPPNFFMLFSTIHYKDNGGFQEFLNGVWDILPEGTPLIGGTVTGFLNPHGCYAKGATAMAISYPNLDVTMGYGKNTKRNPKKAARQCAQMIKAGVKNRYNNKFLFNFVSGSVIPNIPGVKSGSIISSKIMARVMLSMLSASQKILQKGLGLEEEVLEELIKELPNFGLVHGSTIDMAGGTNYQFFNKDTLKNSIVCLALETDIPFYQNFATGAEKTDVNFKITDITKNRQIIKKINNKPAFAEFLRLMNWSENSVYDLKWIDRASRFPLAFYKNDKIILRPSAIIMGNFMGCMGKFESDDVFVAHMTPANMVQAVDDVLVCKKPEFGFFVSCMARQSFLGYKAFESQEKLKKYFQDKPFLLIFTGAEAIYNPDIGLYYLNETITSAIFGEKQ
jgi:hypothetical protein